MGIMISPEQLRRFSPFAGFEEDILKQLAMLGELFEYPADQWIFHEGDRADALYLILLGEVELSLQHGYPAIGNVAVTKLAKGDMFGWSSIVEPYVYNLAAITRKKCRLARFDGVALCEAMTHNPSMGYRLMSRITRMIGARLMDLRVQLVSLVEGDRWQDIAGRRPRYLTEGGRTTPIED